MFAWVGKICYTRVQDRRQAFRAWGEGSGPHRFGDDTVVYDLAVLGAGAAGLRAALGASDFGLSVLLIDRERPGGGAVFYGSSALDGLLDGAVGAVSPSHRALIEAQAGRAALLSQTMEHHLRARQIEYVQASAFVSGRTDGLIRILAGDEEYVAEKLLLAVGSVTVVPAIDGARAAFEDGVVHTERTLPMLEALPDSIIVSGGKLPDLRLAAYVNLCGARVSVVCPECEAAPELDPELASLLRGALAADGIEFIMNARLRSYVNGAFALDAAGTSLSREAGMLLCGGRRRPATRGLGLDRLGVVTRNGAVLTDATGRTNLPEVFAAGDCAGEPYSLFNARSTADTCVRSIAWRKHPPLKPLRVLSIRSIGNVFSVGETFEGALERRIRAAESKLPLPWKGRASGMVKLVADAANRKLLGAHLIGDGAEDIGRELMLSIQAGTPLEEIRLSLFTPSGEITGEALYRLQKTI